MNLLNFRLPRRYYFEHYLISSELTTGIHRPCYCTVHIYVVILYDDSGVCSTVQANLFRICYCLIISVLTLEKLPSERDDGDPNNRFTLVMYVPVSSYNFRFNAMRMLVLYAQ